MVRGMGRVLAASSVLGSLLGCVRERSVEAAVIEVAVTSVDAGAPRVLPSEPVAVTSAPVERAPLVGTWEGTGSQDDGQSWELRVQLTSTAKGTCAVADYPGIPCRAEWRCTALHEGVLVAHEHLLDDGALRCIDDGDMTMRLNRDGTLDWAWRGQGQTASATLHRAP